MTDEKTLVEIPEGVFTIDDHYAQYSGYYQLGGSGGLQIHLAKKPKWLHRKMMKICLGLEWINN